MRLFCQRSHRAHQVHSSALYYLRGNPFTPVPPPLSLRRPLLRLQDATLQPQTRFHLCRVISNASLSVSFCHHLSYPHSGMQTHIYFPTGEPEPLQYAPIWANKTYPIKFMFSQITARGFTLNQLKEDLYTGVFFFIAISTKCLFYAFHLKSVAGKSNSFSFISCLCQPKWSWHSSTSCKRGQEERFSIEKPQLVSMYVCYLEISLHFGVLDTAKIPK